MLNAQSILDQAISNSDDVIEMDDVLAVTGSVSQEVLTDITEAMFDQNMEQTLQLFDKLIYHGKDPGRFVFDMIYFLRDVLFYKTTPNLEGYMERAVVTDRFQQLTTRIDVDWVQHAIVALTDCEQQIKWTNSPRIFVEISILTITNRHEQVEQPIATTEVETTAAEEVGRLMQRLDQLEKKLQQLEQQPAASKPQGPPRRRETTRRRGNAYDVPMEQIRNVLD